METFECKLCDFSSHKKSNYQKHLDTKKHQKYEQKENQNKRRIKYENERLQINNDNNQINNDNQNLSEKIEKMTEEIKELKQANAMNTQKIIKETRAVKKSLLTILNMNFKDTPSIEYIKENDFRKELELEYKCKVDSKDCNLQLKILNDYESKYLSTVLSKLIIKFIKKEDQAIQPVFNVDSSRGNYATKIDDIWHSDKCGLQLKKYTLDMIIKYILNVLDLFRLKLVEIRKENIKKSSMERSDYLMKYSTLLLEVNAYLSNPKTHKQIIIELCPELRFDQKILELLN